ncbi:hypothetical protein TIFTF001_048102, partial [Ficus carica]
ERLLGLATARDGDGFPQRRSGSTGLVGRTEGRASDGDLGCVAVVKTSTAKELACSRDGD